MPSTMSDLSIGLLRHMGVYYGLGRREGEPSGRLAEFADLGRPDLESPKLAI